MLIKEIGTEMKKYRVGHGLTQEEFAQILNISVKSLINYEKGRTQPNMLTVMRFASMVDLTIDDLVFIDKVKKTLKDPARSRILSSFLSDFEIQLDFQDNELTVSKSKSLAQHSHDINSNIDVDY